ncbi:MAG: hypothetical protein A2161_01765, partial [Candidatus Schekmanbacteria bacterium RBG_13_48_7]
MLKIGIVVQRYGIEFAGGSEYLARWLALKLKNYFSVEILTTTAIDAVTWKNHFTAGTSEIDDIPVRRFPVTRLRNYDTFLQLSEKVFSRDHKLGEEFEWLEDQGPVCPDLITYIDQHLDNFEVFIFFTYLYYPTYFGLHHAKLKSIFIPTAHEEPPIFLTIYQHLFCLPAGIIFLAEEEKDFVIEQFGPLRSPWIVTGIGIEGLDSDIPETQHLKKLPCDLPKKPYIFSCGRIESAKGYEQLFDYFSNFKKKHNSSLSLVLAGNAHMDIPESSNIIYKGFVTDEVKMFLLSNAAAVIIPSPLESLSLLALEAWKFGKTVIANGHSRVLLGHIMRGNGGWTYQSADQFDNCLLKLEKEPELVLQTGLKGREY